MEEAQRVLTQFSGPGAYAFFYFAILSCGIGFPLNSDLLMITAAVLAGLGYYRLWVLMPLAILALLSGDSINYWLSRRYGLRLLSKKPFSFILKQSSVTRAERFLNEQGYHYLFFVRFMPFVRTVLYFAAGSLQVPPRAFYGYDGLSTFLYVPLVMGVSFAAGDHLPALVIYFKSAQWTILGTIVLIIIILIFSRKRKLAISRTSKGMP